MRDLGFQTEFVSGADNVQLRLHMSSDYPARDFLAKEIVGESQANFVNLLAATQGLESDFDIRAKGRDEIVMTASATILAQPWHIAALLNTLEGASFLMDEDEK